MYEFSNVIEEGETEKIIFYVTLAHLQVEKGVLSQRIYDEVRSITRIFDISKFVNELGFDDAMDLSERVKTVEAKLHSVEGIFKTDYGKAHDATISPKSGLTWEPQIIKEDNFYECICTFIQGIRG